MQMTHKDHHNRLDSSARLFPGGFLALMQIVRFRPFTDRPMTPERQSLIRQFLAFEQHPL